MRTTKRFTTALLDRYHSLGRGLGTFASYVPWHRVSRSDPASRGRSHLIAWRDRHYELLSDGELIAFLFTVPLLSSGDDLREQFPLASEASPHELAAYDVRYAAVKCPGTLEIATRLGIRHPQCHGDGISAPWVMTTDLLLMRTHPDGSRSLLAISCKDGSALSNRARELLEIEREYWMCRGAIWILLTPNEYDLRVAQTLQRTWPWALATPVPKNALSAAQRAIQIWAGRSLTFVLERISDEVHDQQLGQSALWQSIWWGKSTVDLRRGWRPHLPLTLLDSAEFHSLNPIATRRSAWS